MTEQTSVGASASRKTVSLDTFFGDKTVAPNSRVMRRKPESMGATHDPVAFDKYAKAVAKSMQDTGMKPVQTAHAVTHKGDVYYGMAELYSESKLFSPIIGWRCSSNQRMASSLFVACAIRATNNVCLTTEVAVTKRQVKGCADKLPELLKPAIAQCEFMIKTQRLCLMKFRQIELSNGEAERAIVDMLRQEIISPNRTLRVIEQWDTPDDPLIAKRRDIWRLFNAVCNSYKPLSKTDTISALMERSPRLMVYCRSLALERS